MPRRSRNLMAALGGLIAGACLIWATLYLVQSMRSHWRITAQLQTATQTLQTLAQRDPSPNRENIASALAERTRLQSFVRQVQGHLRNPPAPEQLSNMELRSYLESTRAKLSADAQRAGVEIPASYWFTFAAEKGTLDFPAASVQPLASQLAEVRTLCGVLFDAKINALAWLKRVPVAAQDSLGSQDYLDAKPQTNRWTITVPYEVAFQGYSSDLAHVLERLARLPQAFVVTNIIVELASGDAASGLDHRALGLNDSVPLAWREPPNAPPDPSSRYASRPYLPRVMAAPPGPRTMLEEKPLRFTLCIQAVRCRTPDADLASNSGP